MKKEM